MDRLKRTAALVVAGGTLAVGVPVALAASGEESAGASSSFIQQERERTPDGQEREQGPAPEGQERERAPQGDERPAPGDGQARPDRGDCDEQGDDGAAGQGSGGAAGQGWGGEGSQDAVSDSAAI